MTAVATPEPSTAAASTTQAAVVDPAAAATAAAASTTVTAPVVPEKYAFAMPEKSALEPKVGERLTPILRDLKVLTDADAQKVLDAVNGEATEVLRVWEAARAPGGEVYEAISKGYHADAVKDPFLGAGSAEAVGKIAEKAGELLAHYGPEFAAVLKESGQVLHPAFLRMMKRIAADYGEKASARSMHEPAAPDAPLEKRMFPDLDKVLARPAGAST